MPTSLSQKRAAPIDDEERLEVIVKRNKVAGTIKKPTFGPKKEEPAQVPSSPPEKTQTATRNKRPATKKKTAKPTTVTKKPAKKTQKKGRKRLEEEEESESDDLSLTPPPPSSRPTTKQIKHSALDALRAKRQRPQATTYNESDDNDNDDDDSLFGGNNQSDSDRSGSDSETTEYYSTDGIDDENLDEDNALEIVRGLDIPRSTEHCFDAFVHYIIHLHFDSKILINVTEEDKLYFQAGIEMVEQRIKVLMATNNSWSTCKPPFQATLALRPGITINPIPVVDSADERHCDGCWLGGGCTKSQPKKTKKAEPTPHLYQVKSLKGTYDPATFRLKKEHGPYLTESEFENNAEAPKQPYSLDMMVVVGRRCASRAQKLHDCMHYQYKLYKTIGKIVEVYKANKAKASATPDNVNDYIRDTGRLKLLRENFEKLSEPLDDHLYDEDWNKNL